MTIDYADWNTAQEHANRIATTGAPALRLSTNLGANAGATLLGGANTFLVGGAGPVALNQTALQIMFQAQMPLNTGTLPFIKMALFWSDLQQSIAGGRDTFLFACGNNARNPYNILVPLRGDQVQVQIANLDPAVTATFDWSVSQTSHPYTRLFMFESNDPVIGVNGFTRTAGIPSTGLIAASSVAATVGTPVVRLATAWAGRAFVNVDNSGQASDAQVDIGDIPSLLYGARGTGLFASIKQLAGSKGPPVQVELPNGPYQLTITNLGASGTITTAVHILSDTR